MTFIILLLFYMIPLEKRHPNSLSKDGPGPVLETVGGEFQPPVETAYPGGGDHLIFGRNGRKPEEGKIT
jgi:hypothetical protein